MLREPLTSTDLEPLASQLLLPRFSKLDDELLSILRFDALSREALPLADLVKVSVSTR